MSDRRLEQPLVYPDAPRHDTSDTLHGVRVDDPYRWLEDIDSPETRRWIEAENEVTQQFLGTIAGRDRIRQRLEQLWDYEKFGVPSRHGGRYFFMRNDGLQNQSVLCWSQRLDDEPIVLLDPNTLSADGTVALTNYAVSDDGRLLAYGLSAAGSDWQEWRVREVDTGADRDDLIRWVKFSGAAWTADSQGFFYSRYDAPADGLAYKGANYYHKLYYHRLGTSQDADELIYERPDQREWGFGAQVTEDGRYLIVTIWRGTRRETGVVYRDLHTPDGPIVELLTDFDANYGFVGNDGSVCYFDTDLDAPLSRVIAIDLEQPQREHWREIIPESVDVLRNVLLVGGRIVAHYLHDAHSLLSLYDRDGTPIREIQLPGLGSIAALEGRDADDELFFQLTSFTTPGTIYRYVADSDQMTIVREPRLLFDPTQYVTEQVFYPSKDGTRIPMFISYRRDLHRDGSTPTYLYGYGGFDIPLTPTFSVDNLVWMELGGIYAQASLRGGGEYGKTWHEAGTRLQKQNVFDDFIAAAEWLITNGYTSAPRLAIGGRSNGGLLVGACLTQRPDLYGACLAGVGVLDMLRFHTFTIGWGWVSDYGTPDDPDEFQALLAYSPYHNVRPGTSYPATLITTGDHDDRVFPAHSFKFAAALQATQAGSAPILIRIDTRAGHGMGKPTAKLIDERADMWAFLVDTLRISMEPESRHETQS